MPVKRTPRFRQDTPRQQLGALIGAAAGNISVITLDNVSPEAATRLLVQAQEFLAQAQDIPEGRWEENPDA